MLFAGVVVWCWLLSDEENVRTRAITSFVQFELEIHWMGGCVCAWAGKQVAMGDATQYTDFRLNYTKFIKNFLIKATLFYGIMYARVSIVALHPFLLSPPLARSHIQTSPFATSVFYPQN